MIECDLKLEFDSQARRPASALLVAGSSVESWLRILDWDVGDQNTIRALPVGDAPNHCVAGLVFGFETDLPDEIFAWASPYYSPHPQVFLPCQVIVSPEVDPVHWKKLVEHSLSRLWVPSAGWYAFEDLDVMRLNELVKAPRFARQGMAVAEPGSFFIENLRSISVVDLPSPDEILDDGKEDIGTNSGEIQSLPNSNFEKRLPRSSTRKQLAHLIGKGVNQFTNLFPTTATQRTWVNTLQDWAQSKLITQDQIDQDRRTKEISRLLEILKVDPDAGLKFALPLGGDADRGREFSGNELVQRPTDFSLSGIGGGRTRADWELAVRHRQLLMMRYRELAQREVNLGRFRRAAYVYARLLGDIGSAAKVLVNGHHFREAAVLYRDRMNDPLAAANCLEQGGLFQEAILEYESCKKWESAGDLQTKIGDQQGARVSYRKRVAELKSERAWVLASDLLFRKMNEGGEARELLLDAWGRQKNVAEPIKKYFEINEHEGRHELTRQWLDEIEAAEIPENGRVELFRLLANTATQYADLETKHHCLKKSQVVAAHWLSDQGESVSLSILALFHRLVPEDRLLASDCRRVASQQRMKLNETRPSRIVDRNRVVAISPLQQVRFPEDLVWRNFAIAGDVVYGMSIGPAGVSLARISTHTWDLVQSRAISPFNTSKHGGQAIFDAIRFRENDWLVLRDFSGGIEAELELGFEASRDLPQSKFAFQSCFDRDVKGYSIITAHRFALVRTGVQATVNTYDMGGQLMNSIGIPYSHLLDGQDIGWEHVLPVVFHGGRFFIGFGHRLIILYSDGKVHSYDFDHEIKELAVSSPGTRMRLAVGFSEGGVLFWDNINFGQKTFWNHEIENPKLAFTRNGHLIVGNNGGRVFNTTDNSLQLVRKFDVESGEVAKILPGVSSSQFIVAEPNGVISLLDPGR